MSMKHSRDEIPTIDVNLVTITTRAGKEFGFDTANQIEVEVQTETSDAVRLVVKGILRAQKPEISTITGHKLTLHDNVFNPELVKVLQGGTIYYWQDAAKTTMGTTETDYGFARYQPPVAGSADKGEIFTLNAYSAIYNAAGIITGYEKTMYPNCQGVPVAFNSQDGTFRAPEYTVNSAPDKGEAPYTIDWVPELPHLDDPTKGTVTLTGTDGTATYDSGSSEAQTKDVSTMFTASPSSGIGDKTYSIVSGDNVGTLSGSTLTLSATGSVVIKCVVAENDDYNMAEATANLVVSAA